MDIHTKSKEGLYEATGMFDGQSVTVFKGAKLKKVIAPKYKMPDELLSLRENREYVSDDYILLKDVQFKSFSAAAIFVTARSANGLMTWKTADGKYVRNTLKAN